MPVDTETVEALCARMGGMLANNISPVIARLDRVSSQLERLFEQVEKHRLALEKHDAKFLQIEEKFESLMARLTKVETGSVASTGSGPGTPLSKRFRGSEDAISSLASSAPPAATPTGVSDAVHGRVWGVGFGRELHSRQFRAFGEAIIRQCCPEAIRKLIKIRAFTGSENFSMDFPDSAASADFLVRARTEAFTWADPSDSSQKTIRFKPDRTLAERMNVGALTILYEPVRALIVAKGRWREDMKLGTAGPKGAFFVCSDLDFTKLFFVKTWTMGTAQRQEISFEAKGIASLGISVEEATGVIDAARVALAARRR